MTMIIAEFIDFDAEEHTGMIRLTADSLRTYENGTIIDRKADKIHFADSYRYLCANAGFMSESSEIEHATIAALRANTPVQDIATHLRATYGGKFERFDVIIIPLPRDPSPERLVTPLFIQSDLYVTTIHNGKSPFIFGSGVSTAYSYMNGGMNAIDTIRAVARDNVWVGGDFISQVDVELKPGARTIGTSNVRRITF